MQPDLRIRASEAQDSSMNAESVESILHLAAGCGCARSLASHGMHAEATAVFAVTACAVLLELAPAGRASPSVCSDKLICWAKQRSAAYLMSCSAVFFISHCLFWKAASREWHRVRCMCSAAAVGSAAASSQREGQPHVRSRRERGTI